MSTTTNPTLTDKPPEGVITEQSIVDAKAMIGLQLRPEGPYIQDATPDTMRNFCNGIGDLNPLYRELEYGRTTRHAGMIAHPMFPMAYGYVGRTRWGFPGVHGFFAGHDWELFRHVRPGDRISAIERVLGVVEKQGKFSGRLVMQYVEVTYANQRGEVVAKCLGFCSRHERKAAREAGKYKDIKPHEYTPEEYKKIEAATLAEDQNIRGGKIRYFEDVEEGDELTPVLRGPLSMMDTMGFLVGCGRGHTHGVLLKRAMRHPMHFFRNEDAKGGVEYTGIGHMRDSVAKQVGAPGGYDYGPQRTTWMATLVTNWMGDAAFLKRLRIEARRFNIMGDCTWLKGRVTKKYVKDRHALVDLEIWGENQRGEITTPGLATVVLPSRDIALPVFFDGSALDLELPTIR